MLEMECWNEGVWMSAYECEFDYHTGCWCTYQQRIDVTCIKELVVLAPKPALICCNSKLLMLLR